ncbi:uncharacterized protein LOC106471831 isoform X2 [Limulus polyphemus]|uniref:Uncharacterized protein LOC106471831 isoform X2 n=1 Tax=Limulus polyphemus TaxID=6850 RepID=A0ABM1TJT8_LIMPO|nr:uncharacterized protein LOC106471831 isoform X2 [Limulus polyphemus]
MKQFVCRIREAVTLKEFKRKLGLLQNEEELEEIQMVTQLIEKAQLVRQKGKPKVPKCKVMHSEQVRSREEAVRSDKSRYSSAQRKDVVKGSGETSKCRDVFQGRPNPSHPAFRSSEHQKRMDGKLKQKSSSLSPTSSGEIGVISKTELLQLQRIARLKPEEVEENNREFCIEAPSQNVMRNAELEKTERRVKSLHGTAGEAPTSQLSVVDPLSVLQVPKNFQQAVERNRRARQQLQKAVDTSENPQNEFLKKLLNALIEECRGAMKDKEDFSTSEDAFSDKRKLFTTNDQERKDNFYQQTPIWLWNPHLDFPGLWAMPDVLTYVSQRELQELSSLLWEIQWTRTMLELHKTLKDEAILILEKMDVNDPEFSSVFCHLYSLLGHCGEKFPALLSAQQQCT